MLILTPSPATPHHRPTLRHPAWSPAPIGDPSSPADSPAPGVESCTDQRGPSPSPCTPDSRDFPVTVQWAQRRASPRACLVRHRPAPLSFRRPRRRRGGQMKPSTPGRGRGACVASSLGYRRGRRDQRCGLERFDEDDRWNSGANFDGFSRCVYRVDHIEAYR